MNKYNEKLQEQILIVDDLPENIRLLSSLLSDQGYCVYSATDGKMALSLHSAKMSRFDSVGHYDSSN